MESSQDPARRGSPQTPRHSTGACRGTAVPTSLTRTEKRTLRPAGRADWALLSCGLERRELVIPQRQGGQWRAS